MQAGILEDRESDTDVQAAVRADALLTERQKQVLLDIYASFLKENEATGVLGADSAESTAPEQDVPEQDMPEQPGAEQNGKEEVG